MSNFIENSGLNAVVRLTARTVKFSFCDRRNLSEPLLLYSALWMTSRFFHGRGVSNIARDFYCGLITLKAGQIQFARTVNKSHCYFSLIIGCFSFLFQSPLYKYERRKDQITDLNVKFSVFIQVKSKIYFLSCNTPTPRNMKKKIDTADFTIPSAN